MSKVLENENKNGSSGYKGDKTVLRSLPFLIWAKEVIKCFQNFREEIE
jgi:hypothetical protein